MFPDYPFDSHHLLVNGHKMHYLDEGDNEAEPLIMVHGNPSWSFFFRKPVLALRDKFRCIVPDHIGMGLSEKPAASDYGFTLKNRIDDLEALLDQLGLKDNINLILHDWGGMIGMAYACRYPDRIKRLLIMNTAAFHLPQGMSLPWQLKLTRSLLGPLLLQGFNAFSRGAIRSCVTRKPMEPEVGNAYLSPYDNWGNRLAVLRFVQDIPLSKEDAAYDLISQVDEKLTMFKDTPLLICWGLRDFVFKEDFLDEWLKRFPKAETHRFEDAGHYLLEDASDDVIPLMQNFLDNTPIH